MPIQDIDLGTAANNGTGDDARTAGQKINDNFDYILNIVKIKISGLYVEKYPGNTNPGGYEQYDKFDGFIGQNRYVVGIVVAASASMPADVDDNTKVKLVVDVPVI